MTIRKIATSSLVLAAISANMIYADNSVSEIQNTNSMVVNENKVQYEQNNVVEVSTFEQFYKALKDKNSKTIKLKNNITLNKEYAETISIVNGNTANQTRDIVISKGVSIDGNGHTIDLNNLASIVLKGNDIKLSNITVKNSDHIGIQVYNSRNVYFKEVTVEKAKKFGIFVNGSTVKLENCTTKSNGDGGVLISRSLTLTASNCTDSEVEIINNITHKENASKPNISIKNLTMLNGHVQRHRFKSPSYIYTESTAKVKNVVLSDFYREALNITDPNTKYQEKVYTFNV